MATSLRTLRLVLREWRDGDAAAFAELAADPEVMRYLPMPDADWVARALDHWHEHGFGQWVVEIPEVARFAGIVGLSRMRFALPFAPAVEAAWRLARPHWGQGYATEAARAAIDDGFARLGLEEIVAFTVPANRASRRIMERLGMVHDPAEDFDHPRFPLGHRLRRHVLYRLRQAEPPAPAAA
jgi:RimJ/RimL family protein N-acetyltransferase